MAGRVKVKVEYPRKVAYERFLDAWRASTEDKNFRYVLYRALHSLKKYPLDVPDMTHLKKINGIGDLIAARLDAAWSSFVEMEDGVEPRLSRVKEALDEETCKQIVEGSAKGRKRSNKIGKEKESKKKENGEDKDEFTEQSPKKAKKRAPAVSNGKKVEVGGTGKPTVSVHDLMAAISDDEFTEPAEERPKAAPVKSISNKKNETENVVPNKNKTDDDCIVVLDDDEVDEVRGAPPVKVPKIVRSASDPSSSSSATHLPSSVLPRHNSDPEEREWSCVTIRPEDQAEVILIADSREKSGVAKSKTVVDHLAKGGHRVESRPLSVGDYMWVARKVDGSEMTLDWIVERKTFDDLKSSIRDTRYEEQKQRLRNAPFKNRVYLIEGAGPGGAPEEQALATTLARDSFLIQRCMSAHKSAEFLFTLTEHLKSVVRSKRLSNVCFEDVQEMAKKSKPMSVKDAWIRMLTVIPGMTPDSAQSVANRFPSIVALYKFFKEHRDDSEKRLAAEVPTLSPALAAKVTNFFRKPT